MVVTDAKVHQTHCAIGVDGNDALQQWMGEGFFIQFSVDDPEPELEVSPLHLCSLLLLLWQLPP